MSIDRRDIIQILRDENDLLKVRNQQIGKKLARQQQAFRVLNRLCEKSRVLAEAYSSSGELSVVLYELLGMVLHTCNIDNGSLILIDEAANELEFVAVIGESQKYLQNHRMSTDTGLVGKSILSGEALLIENVHATNQWSKAIDERLNFHTQSLMCVPLNVNNSVVGAIEVVNHTHDTPFDENDLNVFRVATLLVSIALERVEQITLAMEHKS